MHILNAQTDITDSLLYNSQKLDIENLKNQSYLEYADRINCDSSDGTTLQLRICANLELQKQDSLLQIELKTLISEMQKSNDTSSINQINLSQDLWERYRYAQCASCVLDDNKFEMILFMRCATELTIKRREDLKIICDY